MNVKFTGAGDTPERDNKIKELLPKETIIATILEPSIEAVLFDTIAKCIAEEVEIYRKYPKNPHFGNDKKETTKEMLKTFDPRNNGTCYMGKAFKSNSHVIDYELAKYRAAIGTIPHPVWGNCTLLEIWGGDHFEDYNDMVVGVFKYGMNLIDKCPSIKIHVNPLFQNKKSKDFKLSPAQQQYADDMEMLLAKAMVYGVNEPKKKRKR